MRSIRIAVLGAGAVGCYLGGCLAAAGADVALIGRARLQQELEQYGLHLTDWHGRDQRIAPEDVYYTQSPELLGAADFVLVTVKSGATEEAGALIDEHGAPGAVVVSFQNGIHNARRLRERLDRFTVLQGMVPFNVIMPGQGRFHCATEGELVLEGGSGREAALVASLTLAGLRPQLHQAMAPILWGKLLMNLNNPINALSGLPLIEELQQRPYRRVLAASIAEALNLMRRAGIQPARTGKVVPSLMPGLLRVPDFLFRRLAGAMLAIDPSARSSMADDLRLRRLTEVDYLNGEVVRLAQEQGLTAPVNQRIIDLIHQAEARAEGSPGLSGPELLAQVLSPEARHYVN